jgi:hypothetical protein
MKYDTPKALPCGDIICESCLLDVLNSLKETDTCFNCPFCEENCSLPQNRKSPINKPLMDILRQQPNEVEQCNLIKEFKKDLNDCFQKSYDI